MLFELFEKILGMSLIGSYIIGVVFLVRLLLLKCGRKYAYFLWLVVFINLCLPITISAPFSLIPQKVVSVAEEVTGSKKQAVADATTDADEAYLAYLENLENLGMASEELTLPMEDGQQNVQGTSPVDETTVNTTNGNEQAELQNGNITEAATVQEDAHIILSKVSVVEILGLVWMLGMVAVGGYGAVQMLRLNKQIKASKECVCDEAGVVCMEGIESPFLWGLLQPTIYLPASIEASEREYIIAHESFHKKRGDHIVKLLVFAVVAIHWFNPVVWAAYVFFIRDMEISCDEAVLSHAEKNINKQYAGSLLKYAAKQNGFVLSPLTFGEPSLKSRIRNVLQFKKRGMAVTIIAVCVVALTACGLVLKPQPEEGIVADKEQENTGQSGEDARNEGIQSDEDAGQEAQSGQDTQTDTGTEGAEQPSADTEKEVAYTDWEVNVAKQFQAMLGVETEDFVDVVLQGRDKGREYIFEDASGEHYYSYHANLNASEENGFQCEIKWMKLADGVVLQDWHISLQKELEGLTKNASLVGVFYDEEQSRVFIPISSVEGKGIEVEGLADTWVLTFPVDDPDAKLYAYDGAEGAWFGEPLKLGNHLYLHGGSTNVPYEINLETMEGRPCNEELAVAKEEAADFIEQYKAQTGVELHMSWFQALARYEDTVLFAGQIAEAMDFPTVATVYLAMKDGEVVKTRIVEAQEDEINYGITTDVDVTESGDEQQTEEQTPAYKLTAVDREDYNAVFECNGYQYWFKLDIDTTNLSLELGKDVERSNATEKWTVTPVYAVDGEHGVLLGELRGLTFDIFPETYVEHPYVPGERVYGIIEEVTENRVTVQPVEVIDMDTYQEYRMDAAMEPVTYELAKNVEYIMFDPNFLEVNTTFERFTEHVNNNADMVWCFVLVDGEVVEIYEPYMP